MKKLIYCALALAAGLFATSCMQENLEPVQEGNTVTFTVEIPEVATKATVVDNGTNINNLVYAVYRTDGSDLTEAAASIDPTKLVYRINPKAKGEVTAFTADGKTNVTLELINNQKYIVLFWAQVDETWVEGTNFDLTSIAYPRDSELTANLNKYEAFCGAAFVDEVTGATKKSVTLTRPFAQINLASTDPANYDVDIVSSSVKIENVYPKFNVATKKAFGDEFRTVVYADNANPDGKFGDYDHYVAMNYIFANPKNDGTTPVKVTCTINTASHGENIVKEVSNVPVAQNYRTNIVGNLLTSDVDYEVTLDKDWGPEGPVDDDYVVEVVSVASAKDLQEAVNNIQDGAEGNIKLEGDIDLDDLSDLIGVLSTKAEPEVRTYGLLIPNDKSLVLDLNGNTLSQTVNQTGAYSMIQNNGNLTIIDSKGTGKIAYGDTGNGGNYVSNTIGNSGTLVIESGLIENNSSATVAANGYPHPIDNSGELIINGGTLTNNANYSSMRIWCTTDDDTSVTINGGTFNGSIDFQTPNASANKGTLTINGGTFNADTYTNCAVRLLGFGADVDEMFGYIKGGTLNGSVKINKYGAVQELNSQVFYISGGIFSDNPTEFLAIGYATEQDAEGKWIIKECPVKIGDAAYYATLSDAVAAVQEGETIAILAGKTLEEGTVKLPATLKNVTFKGEERATFKDMTIMAHDGSSISYEGLTFDGITFENSRLSFTGWRNGGATVKDFIVTNCVFTKLNDTTNSAPIHFNMAATEPVNGLTFTNNVIDGATGGSKSGIYAQVTGEVLVSGNIINNVSFRPYVIQVTTDDNVADNFVVTNNTFSGSTVGRAQGLGNNAEGTDAVNIVVTENIFKGITDTQQICYWNFNPAKTTADLSHNYYDIDILANPGKIYFNNSAANVYDLVDMGVFPIYTDENKTTTFSPEVNAAKIGETEYATLQEAFNAGGEITLLRNITVDETVVLSEGVTVVLDLNGKTLAAADKNVVKNNGGKLTIKNGTITRTGDVVGYSVNNASGEIVVENATVQRGLYTSGSKLTATNANISHEQSTRHAIYAYNCNVSISGGKIHNDNGGNASIYATGTTAIIINEAEISIADHRPNAGWTSAALDINSGSSITINSGSINGGTRVQNGGILTINGGTFASPTGSDFSPVYGTAIVKGGTYVDDAAKNFAKKYLASGYVLVGDEVKKGYVVETADALVNAVNNAEAGAYIAVAAPVEYIGTVTLPANSTLALNADVTFTTLKAVSGATITIQDGKTLTLNNFSFGSKDAAGAEYEIKGGTVTASHGFFQHGKYSLYSNFETGYMYYSYGSDITVYGTFHSQGKGDGLDYVRGKLTIANGGKSIHDKSLWVGQPADWGAMTASLVIEEGGYVQANSLSVYEGSSLTYSNDADLKYNSVTGTEYITKK